MLRPIGGEGWLLQGGSEASVQGTNDDAQLSKLSCAKAGYFRDDFIHLFVRKSAKRSPLINRGYYSRHSALRQLLRSFLDNAAQRGLPCQVLSLGAGFDTTWFQLQQDHPHQLPARYLEVDFKEVTKRKASIISSQAQLRDLLLSAHTTPTQPQPSATTPAPAQNPAPAEAASSAGVQEGQAAPAPATSCSPGPGGGSAAPEGEAPSSSVSPPSASSSVQIDAAAGQVLSERYCLLPVDLKDLPSLGAALQRCGLTPDAPTFILSECVMVYMEPGDSAQLIRWLGGQFKNAAVVVYEQLKPGDAFGRQMCSNLESRGCPLRGVWSTPTLEAHCQRMRDNCWSAAASHDMDTIYKSFLDPSDKARAERLEMFDEFEEWHMIQEHYCITVGTNDQDGVMGGLGFKQQAAAGAGAGPPLPGTVQRQAGMPNAD